MNENKPSLLAPQRRGRALASNLATKAMDLGEAELAFASDILCWLCHERVIGAITLRNALLALPRYRCDEGSAIGHTPIAEQTVAEKTQG